MYEMRSARPPKNYVLSAIDETSRFTGTGLLKSMREDIACWRMKLLERSIVSRWIFPKGKDI